MGYYSELECFVSEDAKVNINYLDTFYKQSQNLHGFEDVNLVIDGDNILTDITFECSTCDDPYYGQFYDDEKFAEELAKVLTDGFIELHFYGEGGDLWGWEILPGTVIELYVSWQKGNVRKIK